MIIRENKTKLLNLRLRNINKSGRHFEKLKAVIAKRERTIMYSYPVYALVQKPRGLMDEYSVSFQMFLILLSFITIGSES